MFFIWNPRNREHIAKHGVTKEEADFVVRRASPPFPEKMADSKLKVWGPTAEGRLLQVIYVLRALEELNFDELPMNIVMLLSPDEELPYVIHARDLTTRQERNVNCVADADSHEEDEAKEAVLGNERRGACGGYEGIRQAAPRLALSAPYQTRARTI